MNEQQFKTRTKQLALRVIRLVESLPNTKTADVIGKQLLRSATSVGANYRSACRAKSTADLIAKLSIVEEEADETLYWLELLIESRLITVEKLNNLM
ncbi:MAG: four helix bundle protein [Dolichospermum sp.]